MHLIKIIKKNAIIKMKKKIIYTHIHIENKTRNMLVKGRKLKTSIMILKLIELQVTHPHQRLLRSQLIQSTTFLEFQRELKNLHRILRGTAAAQK